MNKLNYTDMLAQLGISSAHPGGLALSKWNLLKEKITKDMKILDLGCGTGKTAAYLASTYKCSVTALDVHPIMLEKAKKRFKKNNLDIELIKGNGKYLPFFENKFDLIITESVLSFTNTKQLLPEIYRVLKHDGRLISIEMTAEEKFDQSELAEIEKVYGIKKVHSETEWKENFTNTGFSKVTIEDNTEDLEQHMVPEENDPSPAIDPSLFEILQNHIKLTEKYKVRLGYRIFKCEK